MNSGVAQIRSQWRLIVFILGLLFFFWLLWVLLSVLLPFVVGFIIACMLVPIIRWFERRLPGVGKKPKLKRFSIVVVIYLLAAAVIGLMAFYVIVVLGEALLSLAQNAPEIIPKGMDTVTQWLKSIPLLSSPSMQQQIDTSMAQAGVALGDALSDFLMSGLAVVQSSSGMIFGFVSMPIFVFFVLIDWDRLRDSFYAALPKWTLIHTKSVFAIIQNVTGCYIRGQLLSGLIVGILVFAMLSIMGIEFALPLAAFAAVMELVPMIGPWLGGAVGIAFTLSTAPEKVIWVAGGYLVILLAENILLVPKIQGSQMQIHPAIIIVLSLVGAHIAGIMGFVIVLPLTMMIVSIFKYFRDSVREGATT